MADMYGRLTGRAGVCLGTLGPGATNLVTAVADAYLDRAPLVAITGQGDLERMHKESHQYLDIVGLMQPITKWNARVSAPEIIPEVVRKAFKVAETEKPGADAPRAARGRHGASRSTPQPLPRRRLADPEPGARELLARRRHHPQRDQPDRAGRQRRRAHRRRAGAARVLPRDRHLGRRDVHGQGRPGLRRPARARHRRPAVARLRDGGLRGRRRRASRSATTSSSTRPSTGTPSATRRSS